MEPYDNPFWEKSNPAEREKRERKKNNAVNSGHFVSVTAHATTWTNIYDFEAGPLLRPNRNLDSHKYGQR